MSPEVAEATLYIIHVSTRAVEAGRRRYRLPSRTYWTNAESVQTPVVFVICFHRYFVLLPYTRKTELRVCQELPATAWLPFGRFNSCEFDCTQNEFNAMANTGIRFSTLYFLFHAAALSRSPLFPSFKKKGNLVSSSFSEKRAGTLNNPRVPDVRGHEDNAVARSYLTARAYRHVSFAGQHALRGYAHVHACIPRHFHEFSIIQIGFSYWVRAGGSRPFSLSIGRGFPAKLFSPPKVTNSPPIRGKRPAHHPAPSSLFLSRSLPFASVFP